MNLARLDFYFPFLVCFYGFLLILADFISLKTNLKNHQLYQQIANKIPLAWTCLFVGFLWSLQNLFV